MFMKWSKRLLSLMLMAAMLFTAVPAPVSAISSYDFEAGVAEQDEHAALSVQVNGNASADMISLAGISVYISSGKAAAATATYPASLAFPDQEDSNVYISNGVDGVEGKVAPGATVKINGEDVETDAAGVFTYMTETTGSHIYYLHDISVTSADRAQTKTYKFITHSSSGQMANPNLAVKCFADAGGNPLPNGLDYLLDIRLPLKLQLPEGIVTADAVAVNSLPSARISGKRGEALPFMLAARTSKLNSDGTLGEYKDAQVAADGVTYTTAMQSFDPGYNLFLLECREAGSDGWIRQGVFTVYRERATKIAKDVSLKPNDISLIDGYGNIFTPVVTEQPAVANLEREIPVWNVTLPAGNDEVAQDSIVAKLLRLPERCGVTVTAYENDRLNSSRREIPGDREYIVPLTALNYRPFLYKANTNIFEVKLDAPNGISTMAYRIYVTREAQKPTAETAALLHGFYGIGAMDISGKGVRDADAFTLRTDRNDAGAKPSGYDFMAEDTPNEFYLSFPNPDTSEQQAMISSVGLYLIPLHVFAGADVTCKTVTDDGTETPIHVDFYPNVNIVCYGFTVPHIGGFTETLDGRTYEYTKIVATINPAPDVEGAQSRSYIFKVPKVAPVSVNASDINVRSAVRFHRGGQLYAHGSDFTAETAFSGDVTEYDVKVDYNTDHIYVVPALNTPDVVSTWRLNGETVTATNSLLPTGIDGVVPVQAGDNTLSVTYKLKNDTTEASAKTYTFHITREANCNAKLSFSDFIGVIGNGTGNSIAIGYPVDKTVFDLTAEADDQTRAVAISQNGAPVSSGTGSVTAAGLSLFSAVTVTVKDTASGAENTYTVSPCAYVSGAPTSVYELMPAPGQFINAGWNGFDSVRIADAIGQPTEDNAGGSGGGCLGTFGGYVVYYYEDPIRNSGSNKYGADFSIAGNAFFGNNEPAAVMVAQDKDKDGKPDKDENGDELWYELAGSLYYDDSTIHDYQITYNNPNPDFMPYLAQDVHYTDNQGNSGIAVRANGFHSQPYYPDWPIYVYEDNNARYSSESLTFTGTLLDAVNLGGRGIPVHFGYAECAPSSSDVMFVPRNPYREAQGCFDIDWAVDKNGYPVHLDEANFIKIYSATLYDKDATGELSPEIMGIYRMDKDGTVGVGRTPKPASIVLKAAGYDDIVLDASALPESGGVVDVSVGERAYVQAAVTSDPADAIFVNNDRVKSGIANTASISITSGSERLVRVIVQRGEMQAYIVLLRLSGAAPAVNSALSGLAVRYNGSNLDELSRTGAYDYQISVPSKYEALQIIPTVKAGAAVTVNDSGLRDDGSADVVLNEAGKPTIIIIKTTYEGLAETTILTVAREADTDSGGKTGTVTIIVEKSTLGQGFIVEPTQITFTEGDTAADVTKALLTWLYGGKGYKSNNSSLGFYLSDIYDPNRGPLNIPSFITKALAGAGVALNNTDDDPDYLGEFDYTHTSGWMITVNNEFIPVSSGSWEVNDGDVIRWQFTLYGLGADVGSSSPDTSYGGQASIVPATNKDALVARIAEINSMSNKGELLKAGSNRKKYDDAIYVLKNLQSTQFEVDGALSSLNNLADVGSGVR